MPIYEYLCKKCGEFEIMQKITENPLARCPTCRSKVTKLMSNTSFQLKGSGWYLTDYARKDGKGSESKPAAKAETESAGKTDTAEKSETKKAKSTDAAAA